MQITFIILIIDKFTIFLNVFRASRILNQFDFPTIPVIKTTYGSVTVSVYQGDITAQVADVIVNGVIDRNFNLSLGERYTFFFYYVVWYVRRK